jgi:hypothetical protein
MNGFMCFLLVRETRESASSELVPAFPSQKHPTARPPTFRVK